MKPWHTIFRNRRGGLCTVCCCLVFVVVVTIGTWAGLCIAQRTLFNVPTGIVEIIAAFGAFQCWKNQADQHYEARERCDDPPQG